MPGHQVSSLEVSTVINGELEFTDFSIGKSERFHHVLTVKGMTASADAFVRTPLFGAKDTARVLLKPGDEVVVVNDPEGYQVMLCGGPKSTTEGPYGCIGQVVSSRFDQMDYTVFLGLLNLTGGRFGVYVSFEPYAFTKSLGLGSGAENVKAVFKSVLRMTYTCIAARLPLLAKPGEFFSCVGSLVRGIHVKDEDGVTRYSVCLDTSFARLFQPAYFSSLSWADRLAIKGSLARWLHAELNSHKSGRFRWTHELQASFNAKCPASTFRTRLRHATAEVCRVTGWSIDFVRNARNYNEKLVLNKTKKAVLLAPASAKKTFRSDDQVGVLTIEGTSAVDTHRGFPSPSLDEEIITLS